MAKPEFLGIMNANMLERWLPAFRKFQKMPGLLVPLSKWKTILEMAAKSLCKLHVCLNCLIMCDACLDHIFAMLGKPASMGPPELLVHMRMS